MNGNIDQLRKSAVRWAAEDTRNIHLVKVIDGEPSQNEVILVARVIELLERHKIQQLKIDTLMQGKSDQVKGGT